MNGTVNQYSSEVLAKYRVWWIPQVPMSPFFYQVQTVIEGKILLDALAKYDLFQYDHNIKPDYCNAGGLEEWNSGDGWSEWYSEDGEDIDYYEVDELRAQYESGI